MSIAHQHPNHRTLKLTWTDIGVFVAAVLAMTHEVWFTLIEWAPDILQGVILIATVIYVIARAAIEVKKFLKGDSYHDS